MVVSTGADLGPWVAALGHYAQALAKYTTVIDAAAAKMRPTGRETYRRALAEAAALASRPPSGHVSERQNLAAGAFEAFGRLAGVRAALDAGAAAALDPALYEEVARPMSRTATEAVEAKAARLRAAREAAAAGEQAESLKAVKVWAPGLAAEVPPEAVVPAYLAGAAAPAPAQVSLYAAILQAWVDAGGGSAGQVGGLLEGAKDDALGLAPDTPLAVQQAAAGREGLHPLQAMGITFGLTPSEGPEEGPPAAVAIDMTLPQARTAVRYSVARLVDARVAAMFGPVASMRSGLNYRLVNRLRSITEDAVGCAAAGPKRGRPACSEAIIEARVVGAPPPGPPAIIVEPGGPPRVVRTIDRGGSYEELRPPPPAYGGAAAYASVGAGPRPRVQRLGALLEEAVFGGGAEGGLRTLADPSRLVADFSAAAGDGPPGFTLNELGRSLCARFAEECDARPPASAEEVLHAVLGLRGSRDLYRTYIAQAITEVSKRGAERLMLQGAASGVRGGAALLFGSQRAGAQGHRQEVLLTQITNLRVSTRATQKKLAAGYARLDGERRALGFFPSGGGAPPLAAGALRARVLELHRDVVDEALQLKRRPSIRGPAAQAVEKGDGIEPRPCLKLYVLGHGGGG